MTPARTRLLAILYLAALTAVNAWRAATQALTHDEALSQEWFLSGPWSDLWRDYNANHHVLYNALARLCVALWGTHEWSQRLPSVAAGALYFYFAYRLARALCGERGWFLLGLALLTLNPYLLDYFSAARGYGLALALLLGALWLWLRPAPARPAQIGAWAGLAIGANFTMLFPVCALLGAMLVQEWRWRAAVAAGAVAALTAGAILIVPMSHVEAGAFYVGSGSLLGGWESVIRLSALHEAAAPGWARWVPASTLVAGGLGLAMASSGAVAWLGGRDRRDRAACTVGVMLALLVVETVAAHGLAHLPYPELRTGLYFLPLWTLAALRVAPRLPPAGRWAAAGVLGAIALQYAAAFDWRYYAEWKYAAATRRTMEAVRERGPRADGRPIRLGASWVLEPSLNYYRRQMHLTWVAPIRRVPVAAASFDYYALLGPDRALAPPRALTPIFDDPLSGEWLGVP